MTIDIYVVYDVEEADVIGVFSSYDNARDLIESYIQIGCVPEDFLIYMPPIDIPFVIGNDSTHTVPYIPLPDNNP